MNYKEERRKDAETPGGHIYKLRERGNIVDNSQEKDFVFISYSSKDWEKVLYEIVYDICTKKGLRVYFDTKFDEGDESWLTQFKENMDCENCKAVLAFVSPNYKTSYATLMELMASREKIESASKPVLPIYIGNAATSDTYKNTGLGTQRFPDATTNDMWDKELELFNKLFISIIDDNGNDSITDKTTAGTKYSKSKNSLIPYKAELIWDKVKENNDFWDQERIPADDEETKKKYWDQMSSEEKRKSGEIYLRQVNNAWLVDAILSNLNKNKIDGVNKDITEAIYAKLSNKDGLNLGSVFDPDLVIKDDYAGCKTVIENVTEDATSEPETVIYKPDRKICRIIGNGKSYDAFYRCDGEKYTILRGSRIRLNEKWTPKSILNQYEDKITKEGILLCDISDLPISTAAKLIEGTSTAGKELLNEKNILKVEVSVPLCKMTNKTEGYGEEKMQGYGEAKVAVGEFEYELWGISHTASKLVDMMNGVFDLIAEKYPDKIQAIADDGKITAVARKDELDQGKLQGTSKANQFAHYKSKDHSVNGVVYCVNAGYNREGGVSQIKKMLVLCEGSADGFRITKAPEKSSHSGSKSGKKGLGELLN